MSKIFISIADYQGNCYKQHARVLKQVESTLSDFFIVQYKLLQQTKAENITERITPTPVRKKFSVYHIKNYRFISICKHTEQQQEEINEILPEETSAESTFLPSSLSTKMNDTTVESELLNAIQTMNRLLSKTSSSVDHKFYYKPTKYNGSRDPLTIENWVTSVDNYTEHL